MLRSIHSLPIRIIHPNKGLMDMKTALVTGASGFISSHLIEKLLQKNYRVKALVHYNSNSDIGWLKQVKQNNNLALSSHLEIIFGDIRDTFHLDEITNNTDIIFHLAALISIPHSYTATQQYIDTNIIGTHNILQLAKTKNIQTLITSTSEVYGTAQYIPINEKHPKQPQSPYSATKIAADALSQSFINSFDAPITIVRPFNTYGPRQSTRAFIPQIITQLLQQPKQLQLGNIHTTRDLVYVEDTADAFIKIAETDLCTQQTINIATGKMYYVEDVATELIQQLSKNTKIKLDKKRLRPNSSEVHTLMGDARLLEKLTGYKPRTPLKLGLAKTINWFKNNNHHYPTGYTT